ncbi:hypothetical protein JI735_19465 [Paenibacillus sonchi]|uniref:Uncharacterized protein n=1 Tax=Paenibacillus sonchi TaxID=373687 RepID=A0A974P8Y3_9BACL|nr:hypothetical protein [Paenibacillus sonchi]QQZ58912.1 hypothetical protein JI735_19465 [Paenibacillus sonchi]
MAENLGAGGKERGIETDSEERRLDQHRRKTQRVDSLPHVTPAYETGDDLAPVIFQRKHEYAEQKLLQFIFKRNILESIK